MISRSICMLKILSITLRVGSKICSQTGSLSTKYLLGNLGLLINARFLTFFYNHFNRIITQVFCLILSVKLVFSHQSSVLTNTATNFINSIILIMITVFYLVIFYCNRVLIQRIISINIQRGGSEI